MSARSRSPRLRGGYKQRLGLTLASRVAKETKPATPGYSPGEVWATHVATQFLTNKSSAIQSQEAASFSSAAGAAGVDTLAKIGNHGKAPKNCARDLKRVVQRGTTAPVPYMVSIPITEPKHNRVVEVEHPVLLPHEMIAYIISTGRATVKELADVVPRSDQTLAAHKHKFCVDHQVPESTCIPLGFHGDGVPFQKSTHKQSSTEVYSWNFLCDRDGKRHLFANIHKEFLCMCGCAGRCTMEALFAVFVWSMQILMGGLHPHKRHDGGPLDAARAQLGGHPLGFNGVLLQARGDWQWYNQVFHFPSWSSGSLCWLCKASKKGRFAFTKCGPSAAWRTARYSDAQFLAMQLKENITPSCLFSCPGFGIAMVCIGALHCLDAGVTADIIGNILWEAVLWLGLPGRTQKLRVIPLWRMMQQFYKDNSVKGGLQGLTILMIKQQGKSPKIRCKAAQARHLIGFASLVAQQLHDRWQSDHTRLVLQVATCLEQLQLVMDKAWDPEVARALSVQVATGFVKLNQEALGELKLGAKLQRWRVKPKLHMMQELLEYQAFSLGNPRGFWEYLDEDFVGIISTLALKKGGANTHLACSTNVISRYRALLCMGQV